MTKPEFISAELGTRVTAHALHVGDRINTMGFEDEALSAVPLAIRAGEAGIAVLFRYGVAVLIGLSPEDEIAFLEKLKPRIGGKLTRFEEETAVVALAREAEDQVLAGGPIQLRDMSPERLLVIAWRRVSCSPMTNARSRKYSKLSNPSRKSWPITAVLEEIEKGFCS
jgi:required for meiotic nuclear division protein 1